MKESKVFIVIYYDAASFPQEEDIAGVFTTETLAETEAAQIVQQGDYSARVEEWTVRNCVTPEGQ